MTPFSQALRAAREAAGHTQCTLSAATGIGRSTITMCETGQRLPTLAQARLLEPVLGVDLAVLAVRARGHLTVSVADLTDDQILRLLREVAP